MELFRRKQSDLQEAKDKLLKDMHEFDTNSVEYRTAVEHLETLYNLEPKKGFQVSGDTVIAVIGNLLGVLIIVHYEQANVMASKAMAMIGRNKPTSST